MNIKNNVSDLKKVLAHLLYTLRGSCLCIFIHIFYVVFVVVVVVFKFDRSNWYAYVKFVVISWDTTSRSPQYEMYELGVLFPNHLYQCRPVNKRCVTFNPLILWKKNIHIKKETKKIYHKHGYRGVVHCDGVSSNYWNTL